MSIKDALLATISAEDNSLNGRTLLQKKVYFLSVISGEDFGYTPHYYGPYSADVAQQLEALVEARLVTEKTENFLDSFGPFGEVKRYDYSLPNSGREFLARRQQESKGYREILGKINSHALAADSTLLSAAAKVFYIVAESGGASVKQIRERALSLGWDVSPQNVQLVIDYLEHVDLISPK